MLFAEDSKGHKTQLWRIIASYAISMLGFWLSVTLTSLILAEQNVNPAVIGVFASMPWLAIIVLSPLFPFLVRKFGAACILRWGVYLAIASVVGFALSDSLVVWFVCNLLVGISFGMRWVVADTWVLTEAPPEKLGRVMGLHEMVSSAMIGVGPFVIYITGTTGYIPFIVAAASYVAALALVTGIRSPKSLFLKRFSKKELLSTLRQHPSVFLVALMGGLVESGALPVLPTYALSLGFQPKEVALFVTAVGIGNVITQYPLGHFAERINYYRLVMGCCAAALFGLFIIPTVSKVRIIFWILAPLWGSILGSFYTIAAVRAGTVYSKGNLVQAVSLMAMLYTLGSVIGPTLGGGALAIWKPHGFTIVFSVITASGLMAIAALSKKECGSKFN